MKNGKRYDTNGLLEAQFEPGSDNKVLRNLLGGTDSEEMARIETRELVRVTEKFLDEVETDQSFTADDICRMHRDWLGAVYPWAGCYRQVTMSKGGFLFAAPAQIPALMTEFEQTVLQRFTPCRGTEEEVLLSLATVHVELVLIHPFREGNGRIARLLALLMGLQTGLPPFDFSAIEGEKRESYFAAVRDGMDRNYAPMAAIFAEVIRRSLVRAAGV